MPHWRRDPVAHQRLRDHHRPTAIVERPTVREEPLRTHGARGIDLSCWRGRSARRYVVVVYTLAAARAVDGTDAVILAVHRKPDARARIVAAGHRCTVAQALALWVPLGCNELHLIRIAQTEATRDAIVADLVDDGSS